ncbi:TolB family protein [Sphingomicrobium marinum]|uniref:TolB family protein n=1 Tax=Sphingomicrobium marinum TaxID=1227950 RepID=UPI00223F6ACC|nr:hypothetical protein [Sphingomicrobium marinum]
MNIRLLASVAAISLTCGTAQAQQFGAWGDAEAVTSVGGGGCPILDPYTNDLFIASGRDGGFGSNDIWRAPYNGSGWDAAVNVGPTINTAAPEYCPSPARGRMFFFVRSGDIYMSKVHPKNGYGAPVALSDEINAADEWSPTYLEDDEDTSYLYFSSDRDGTQDIYVSVDFGTPTKIVELSSDDGTETRPNVRRDRLELVYDDGAGNIYFSSRESTDDPWGPPVLFTKGNGSRASFSWDGMTLVWGDGGTIMKSTRSKLAKLKMVDTP